MSLLLTRNCHYALLVAIDEGQQFNAQDDRELYITSRLNLKLPRAVDDLIPPNTRINTRPTSFTQTPKWRTALIYYLSNKILYNLIKRQGSISLEILSVSEEMHRENLGFVELQVDHAKVVRLHRGNKEITQIQQFVINKGDWLRVNENGRAQIKAGLFIVEMPNNATAEAKNKEVGTPLQMPIRTSNQNPLTEGDLGMEICSDMSDLFPVEGDVTFLSDEKEENGDAIYDKSEYLHTEEDLNNLDEKSEYMGQDMEEYEEEERNCIYVGKGSEQYSFLFQLIEVKHMSSIMEGYIDIQRAFIRYAFANREYEIQVNLLKDKWEVIEYQKGIPLQGSLDDVQEWLNIQEKISVYFMIEYVSGEEDLIGFADVYLKGRGVQILEQSSIVFDRDRMWHINQDKMFTKLQLKVGLVKGWDALEDDIYDL
ncbi:hypothetical protein G6F46_009693 [Rhizopus delemar]|uniref:Uncharacterized protein n=2 Tax=Rhizopus TaxID=4842 RepID=A0A9P6ZED0_9FUNG|nr:hypothetical protein G6F55_000257 [Rhizopus delemar]KAG1551626.1 hypothetical protein G6F51_001724 [Rhizopus arrhizus]KAG1505867.1 hypothetical protein G6F54_000022 [Rhizopus delemar]KAG1506666.1 hypothetical protein G6F53_009523 [Rhizopus delemar]KAG1521494.1 hypothetical protein G6F52_006698 [Rhizopus delemar]